MPAHTGDRTAQVAGKRARVCSRDRKLLSLRDFIFPNPKTASQNYRRLRTFVLLTVQLRLRAAHGESIGCDEHHVRWRNLLQRAVELLRRKMRCGVDERDAANVIGDSAQYAPPSKICRLEDGVNTGGPQDSKLKRAG